MNEQELKRLYAFRDDFVIRLNGMFAEAHRAGFHRTGHALHAAVQTVGWELAEQLIKAQKPASRPRRARK